MQKVVLQFCLSLIHYHEQLASFPVVIFENLIPTLYSVKKFISFSLFNSFQLHVNRSECMYEQQLISIRASTLLISSAEISIICISDKDEP